MITGRRAFEGKSQATLIAAIMASDPEPICVLQPMAPRALDHLVRRCLARDPEERWQSASDGRRNWSGSPKGHPNPCRLNPGLLAAAAHGFWLRSAAPWHWRRAFGFFDTGQMIRHYLNPFSMSSTLRREQSCRQCGLEVLQFHRMDRASSLRPSVMEKAVCTCDGGTPLNCNPCLGLRTVATRSGHRTTAGSVSSP